MAQGFGQLVLTPKQKTEAKILSKSVLQNFQNVEVPRVGRRRAHNFASIISIAILAVLSGANGFVDIETDGKAKQEWLETFLDLSHGIPSHDTFGRVFGMLDPEEVHKGFQSWVETMTEKMSLKLIHIDGKTLRKSYDREKKLKALTLCSAFSREHNERLSTAESREQDQ